MDAIAMACQVYQAIQTLRAREVDPFVPCVIGIGEIHGGFANNVVCGEVMLHGSIRTLDQKLDEYLFRRIEEIACSISREMGGSYSLETTMHYPALSNDHAIANRLTRAAEKVVGKEQMTEHPLSMEAEDFAFFLQKKPGACFRLGARRPGDEPVPLHNSKFSPDEDALTVAPEIFFQYILDNQD